MQHRRPAALLGAAALVAAAVTAVTVGPAAQAADTPRTALGAHGQKLTVSASANLDPAGETLRVTGEGYDVTKGVYVALCKDNGDNRIPTPCLGGADQTGGSGASKWIVPEGSAEAPAGVAEVWGPGGTFDVELDVKAKDNGLDCTEVACSVVTRVDHNGTGDRSQDVRIPVAFEGQEPGGGDGGEGEEVPPGTVSYVRSAEFTAAGMPLSLLLHPDSGRLYVGSGNTVDTGSVNESGLYVLDPADGKVLSYIPQAPGTTGALAQRVVQRLVKALPGDGVVFQYPVRGIGVAKTGDSAATGVWPAGGTITGTGPGTTDGSVLIAQGAVVSEVEYATGKVLRTVTLPSSGGHLGVDPARRLAWVSDTVNGKLFRVSTAGDTALDLTATLDLPQGQSYVTAVDPATGNVWAGSGYSVFVFDKDGEPLAELKGTDMPTAIAFDAGTHQAFVLREDYGNEEDGADQKGLLEVYDSGTFRPAATPAALPGNRVNAYAGLAVVPGGGTVYLTDGAESKVLAYERRVSPKVTQTPTDRTVFAGDQVTFVAAAEGTPTPTLKWEVSPDGGQTWTTVAGATGNTYSFTARAAHDGYRYRVAFTNTSGTTRTAEFTLTVKEAGNGDGGTGGGDGDGDEKPSGTRTVTGSQGQKLTVTPVNNLATEDQVLKITGSGYDEKKGIYVALCVDNGPGQLPTPCVGGVDMTGSSHSSAWISSNPPDYGEELATPYGTGGSFSVELTVDAKDEFTDCFKQTCVLATRADHTLSGDRSQDVKVPVSFVGQPPVDTDDGGTTGGSTGGSTGGGSTGETDGGTTGGGSSGGTTGSTGGTGSAGGTGGTTTTGSSGSLASTGATVGTVAGLALLLAAGGWYVRRRALTAR
ncbi:immunoglobulin I-set domain protein [Streptomyces antibioticus]|uniref:immunoglobulin I-set domain protein n=1 Tax=Streptomyces antibioticus TaxID=1890 RepID=UPI0036F6A390